MKTPSDALTLPAGIAGSVQLLLGTHLSAAIEPGLNWEALQAQDDALMQAILAHDRVVQALFEQTTVLPLRFGTRFPSTVVLLGHLEEHRSRYQHQLDNLEHKVEYSLRLIAQELTTESVVPTQGRDYFMAKKKRYQAQLDYQQQQSQELQGLLAAITQIYPDLVSQETQGNSPRIHLLINRQDSEFFNHLQSWQAQCPSWEIQLSEALPPYHFI